jgi:hypothetical protein
MSLSSLTHEDSTIILIGFTMSCTTFMNSLSVDCHHLYKLRIRCIHQRRKPSCRWLCSYASHNGVNVGCLPSYRNFMVSMHKLAGYGLVFLEAVRKYCTQGVKLQFTDVTAIPVCRIKREFNHRVAKSLATTSKGTMGWYYRFKLHLVCDKNGIILAWRITTATVDDRKGLALVWHELNGIIVAAACYLGSNWQKAAANLHLILLTGVKKIMRKLMTRWQYARQRIETTFSIIKFRLGMDTTLPRSVNGYFAHYVWCLLAYQLRRLGQLETRAGQTILTDKVA